MQNRSLENDEGRSDVVLDLDLDGIRQILRYRGHREEVRGPNEEVAVERRHAQIYPTCQYLSAGRQDGRGLLFDARTRMTASNMIGMASTSPNSCANFTASSVRAALNAG